MNPSNETELRAPLAGASVDCNGSVFTILVEASERPAVACSEWLDLGRAIQFSHVPLFSVPLGPESETAESK
jgi:hypothetical protein